MPLELMYITNRPDVARVAVQSGVERIFVDMEYIGKEERQYKMDTVKNHHTLEDVSHLRAAVPNCTLLVRVNPLYDGSLNEIAGAVARGADRIMLPMWKNAHQVETFLTLLDGRAKATLLLETAEAAQALPDVLSLGGDFEVHIGLNDLHLSLGQKFLFEPLADGTVDRLAEQLHAAGVRFGIGGFGHLGSRPLPAELIVAEHYRLGSEVAILSRSFLNPAHFTTASELLPVFEQGVAALRRYEAYLATCDPAFFENNKRCLRRKVAEIVREI